MEGTKGRFLQDNYRTGEIRIHHKEVPIEAEIETLDALSAHADSNELMLWLKQITGKPKVYVNHGSEESQKF